MSRFFSDELSELTPYTPGEQPDQTKQLIKLNTNENPYGPGPMVAEVLREEDPDLLRLYPDPEARELTEAIADYYGLTPDQVAVTNGSDEALAFAFMAFSANQRKVYFPEISYGFYPVFGHVFRTNFEEVPLRGGLTIDPQDYFKCDGPVIIANPNAPTGIALEPSDIVRILESDPGRLLIVDEAYVDFGAKSCVPLIDKYDNLLIIQTFSKSRSLAGSRVGFAMGQRDLISDINTIKFSFNPYSLDRLAVRAASAAMRDTEHFETTRKKIMATREKTMRELKDLDFHVIPSKANFLFARHDLISGEDYFAALRENDIIVRHFGKPRIAEYVRISIGTDEQMEQFLKVTRKILNALDQED